jgi:hypothetical protein
LAVVVGATEAALSFDMVDFALGNKFFVDSVDVPVVAICTGFFPVGPFERRENREARAHGAYITPVPILWIVVLKGAVSFDNSSMVILFIGCHSVLWKSDVFI